MEKWGIGLHWLITHFVYPVDQMYINRYCQPIPKYKYKESDPCYAYVTGLDSNGISIILNVTFLFEIEVGEVKFITNHNGLVGILISFDKPKYDITIITKCHKDNLALGNWLYSYP